jgi:hypothetical protein
MLLIDSAEFQGKEMARICNVPLYLVGFDQGSYAYPATRALEPTCGLLALASTPNALPATLSQNNVLPNGTYVEFDTMSYLMGDYSENHDMTQPELADEVQSQS